MGEIQFNCKIQSRSSFFFEMFGIPLIFTVEYIIELINPWELDIAEQKLNYLSQCETFPGELKLLSSSKIIIGNSRIAKYSPFIGRAGILRWTGRISCLVNSDFNSKDRIKLDARHAIFRLVARHLHVMNFHQCLAYMRSVFNLKCVGINWRWLLQNFENKYVMYRKRRAETPISNTGVNYFGPFLAPIH